MPLIALALAAGIAAWQLTPEGLGPIRIGMGEAAVARASGRRVKDFRTGDADDDAACHTATLAGLANVGLMFERGRLTRVTLIRTAPFATPEGYRIGARERVLRAGYGARLRVTPADYDSPGRSLLVWTRYKQRGLRYLTDARGRVTMIHAGAASIEYIENCL